MSGTRRSAQFRPIGKFGEIDEPTEPGNESPRKVYGLEEQLQCPADNKMISKRMKMFQVPVVSRIGAAPKMVLGLEGPGSFSQGGRILQNSSCFFTKEFSSFTKVLAPTKF